MGQKLEVCEKWYDEENKCLMVRAKNPDGGIVEGVLLRAGVPDENGDIRTEEFLRKIASDEDGVSWSTPLWMEAYKRVHLKKTLGKLYQMVSDGDKLSSEATDMFTEAMQYLYDKPTLVNNGG